MFFLRKTILGMSGLNQRLRHTTTQCRVALRPANGHNHNGTRTRLTKLCVHPRKECHATKLMLTTTATSMQH